MIFILEPRQTILDHQDMDHTCCITTNCICILNSKRTANSKRMVHISRMSHIRGTLQYERQISRSLSVTEILQNINYGKILTTPKIYDCTCQIRFQILQNSVSPCCAIDATSTWWHTAIPWKVWKVLEKAGNCCTRFCIGTVCIKVFLHNHSS